MRVRGRLGGWRLRWSYGIRDEDGCRRGGRRRSRQVLVRRSLLAVVSMRMRRRREPGTACRYGGKADGENGGAQWYPPGTAGPPPREDSQRLELRDDCDGIEKSDRFRPPE